MTRATCFARIGLAYAVALAVAAVWLTVGPDTGRVWLDTLIADVLATLVIFGFSRRYRNSSVYDAYWSVVPPLLLVYWWWRGHAGIDDVRCWLIAIVVVAWSVRLTWNWASSFPGLQHEDWRYQMLRDRSGRWPLLTDLFAIHLVPTLQVFIGMLPVCVAVTSPGRTVMWLDVVALVVGIGAVTVEFVADRQLHRFLAGRLPGETLADGLWSWSRHPNYFGEFGFWVAMALFGVAAAPAQAWWLFVGAVMMLAMFLGASIPMMEQRSLQRRPHYADVIGSVSKFVPRPPRRRATR